MCLPRANPPAHVPLCAGMQLGGQLEDPRLAGELLWPTAAEEDPGKLDLKRLQSSVVPGYKVSCSVLSRFA